MLVANKDKKPRDNPRGIRDSKYGCFRDRITCMAVDRNVDRPGSRVAVASMTARLSKTKALVALLCDQQAVDLELELYFLLARTR